MSRIFIPLLAVALLAGCDGENPFQLEATAPSGDTEPLDPNDPNTDVNSKFAFDPAESLTMNSVEYDDVNDELIINNLPFDGPDGRYDAVAGTQTTSPTGLTSGIYESRQTATTGQIKHYAVFIQGDYVDATSAAGRDWSTFGNAGANINRDSFNLPGGIGEYVYVGVYAATRTYDQRGGLELITGNVNLLLDVEDFDPNFPGEGLQGDIVGTVTNRTRQPTGNQMAGALPSISLIEVSFNTATGVWDNGSVATVRPNGDARDSGLYEGMIAGPDGEEMAGYLVMEGVADIQVVTYQVVNWEIVSPNGTQTGTTTGLQLVDFDSLQGLVNAGIPIGPLNVTPADLPTGATPVGATTTQSIEIDTDYQAREIGVFVTDQL